MSLARTLLKLSVYQALDPLQAVYNNDGLPSSTVTSLGSALDYIVSSMFPNARPAVATELDLPTGTDTPNIGDITPTENDYRIVLDYNSTGQAAGYRFYQLEGQPSAQWNLVQNFDSQDSILQQWELNASALFVNQNGVPTGQTIHGSTDANENLVLSANSGDGSLDPALQTGFVEFFSQVRPTDDNVFNLGTITERFKDLYLSGNLSDGTNSLTVANAKTAYDHSQIITGNPHAINYEELVTRLGNLNVGGDVDAQIIDLSTEGNKTLTLNVIDDSHNHTTAFITDFNDETWSLLKARLVDGGGITWAFNDPLKEATATVSIDTSSITDIESPAANKVLTSDAAGSNWRASDGTVELTGDVSGSGTYNSTTDKVEIAATVDNIAIDNIDRINTQNLTVSVAASNPAAITQVGHGLLSGRKVRLLGTTFDGEYTVTVVDPNNYTIAYDNSLGAVEAGHVIPNASQFLYDSVNDEWIVQLENAQLSHFEISGLAADDHTQYVHTNGRTNGTNNVVTGGELSGANLYLRSTSDATKGAIRAEDNVEPETGASYSGGWSGLDIGADTRRWRDLYLNGVIKNLRVEEVSSLPTATIQDKARVVFLNGGDLYINKTGASYFKIIDETERGAANGVAPLGATSKIDNAYLNYPIQGFEQEAPSGLVNGANVTYGLSSTPTEGKAVSLYINGLIQRQGVDYTIAGAVITMTTAPAIGQDIWAIYTY